MATFCGFVRGLLVTAAFALASGCSSDNKSSITSDGGGGAPGTGGLKNFCELPKQCQDIAQECMPKDDGSPGLVHDCHLTGHEDGTLATCSAKYDQCIKACKSAPALSDGPVEDLSAPCRDASAKNL
jgi:hypothetical protein